MEAVRLLEVAYALEHPRVKLDRIRMAEELRVFAKRLEIERLADKAAAAHGAVGWPLRVGKGGLEMSVEQVKYLTREQVIEHSPRALQAQYERTLRSGFVFPVTEHLRTDPTDGAWCTVSVFFRGVRDPQPVRIDLPLLVFESLPTWPTLDIVADIPRLVAGGE